MIRLLAMQQKRLDPNDLEKPERYALMGRAFIGAVDVDGRFFTVEIS